jgi:outer membrane protein assembly factor BamB
VLSLARAVPDRYDELAEAKVLTGHDSWGPLALVGGRLLARDLTTMVCLDVSAEGNAATAREPGTKE